MNYFHTPTTRPLTATKIITRNKKMKPHIVTIVAIASLGFALTCNTAFAGNYGTNITIFDGERTNEGLVNPIYEDNETEPGMVQSQEWDLEGFFLKGNILTMIGGFNFKTGVPGYNGLNSSKDFTSGDLFISTNASYGRPLSGAMYLVGSAGEIITDTNGNNVAYNPLASQDGSKNVSSSFGYEYALDINWAALTFSIVQLNPDSATTTVYYHQNEDGSPSSNPWKYFANGTIIGQPGTVNNLSIVNDSGFSGMGSNNTHYAVSFDLSNFFSVTGLYGQDFYTHFTMGCGNDNLMGQGTAPVPEPGTLLLFGTGLAGLGAFARRKGLIPTKLHNPDK